MLQRMSLLSGGAYDVWGFTWQDVDAAFTRSTPRPPMLLHPNSEALKKWYGSPGVGLGQWVRVLDTTPLELLVTSLSADVDPIPWAKLAAVALIAQMAVPPQVDVTAWKTEIGSLVPAPLRPPLLGASDQSLFARRPASDPGSIGLWATTSRAAASDLRPVDDFRAVLWLDDERDRWDMPAFREAWRGYLFAFLLLRALPQVLFLTKTGAAPDGYARLAALRTASSTTLDARWSALDVGPGFEALVEGLANTNVELPEVGMDLPDARGLSSGVEGELVWEPRRVAVVRTLNDNQRVRIAPEWSVFELASCAADITPLLSALQGAPPGDPT
jgi:hypothetical protein